MKYFLILLVFWSFTGKSQQAKEFVVPNGYTKVCETRGDLDKDGTAEVVYVYNTNQKNGELGFFRELYICKIREGKQWLWKQNVSLLSSSKDCGFCEPTDTTLQVSIKNNVLVVSQRFQHSTRHLSSHTNKFRFQNGDWFLIGSTFKDGYSCDSSTQYDINFSTNQVAISQVYEDCEEGKQVPKNKSYRFPYPFPSLIKMEGFTPGQVTLKVPRSGNSFYY